MSRNRFVSSFIGLVCATLITPQAHAVTLYWGDGYCELWHNGSPTVDPGDYSWDPLDGILRLDAPGLWEAEYYTYGGYAGHCTNLYTSSISGDYFELRLWANAILNDLDLTHVNTAQNFVRLTLVRTGSYDAYGFLNGGGATLYNSLIEGNAGGIRARRLGGWGMDIEGHLSGAEFDEIESGTLHVFDDLMAGDLDGDGDVDLSDLAILLSNYGLSC
jgi:hypothetical protein